MTTGRRLVVSADLLKKVDESQSQNLKKPEDAVEKGSGADASYGWMEVFKVVGSQVTQDKKNKDRDVFEVTFTVPKDSPFTTNAGRQFKVWWRVNADSLVGPDSGDKTMSFISLARLKGLVHASGLPVAEGEDVDFYAYFSGNGPAEPAPVVGLEVVAKMVDKPDKDDNLTRRQEIVKFLSLDEAGIVR